MTNRFDVKIARAAARTERRKNIQDARAAKRAAAEARRNSPEAIKRRKRLRKGFMSIIKPFKKQLKGIGHSVLGKVQSKIGG